MVGLSFRVQAVGFKPSLTPSKWPARSKVQSTHKQAPGWLQSTTFCLRQLDFDSRHPNRQNSRFSIALDQCHAPVLSRCFSKISWGGSLTVLQNEVCSSCSRSGERPQPLILQQNEVCSSCSRSDSAGGGNSCANELFFPSDSGVAFPPALQLVEVGYCIF